VRAHAQVSLWDRIIETKEDARFSMPFVRNKYKLQDQASVCKHQPRGTLQRATDLVAFARRGCICVGSAPT
jgi:hypothetical protein